MFIFIVSYVLLEIPLSMITGAIPKVLKSFGMIKTSKGIVPFILDISLTFGLIVVLDTVMEGIEFSWYGSLLFALFTGFISMKLKKADDEPPMIDSEEFKEIGNRLLEKKKT
ncbi:hypothetical protein J2S19_001132 [Metabacillus malikii]|uniref:Uncharacterized protein n=1 Tax=Metabacillus malikii TaxID=1504265 RepID=A0ABT9ZF42_9BACI|nr:hypothetical protein [Metabacillus malikii]